MLLFTQPSRPSQVKYPDLWTLPINEVEACPVVISPSLATILCIACMIPAEVHHQSLITELVLLAYDLGGVNHVSYCRSPKPGACWPVKPDQVPLHLCSGHSLVMWSAVCLSAQHSHEADGASPNWFMLCLNLPYPVLIRLRRTSEFRLSSCQTGFFDGIGINSLSLQSVVPTCVYASFVHVVFCTYKVVLK